ncbi:MAG: NrpR regulatory domain-containing protein [Desulfobacterota bacterium]|nr:NrpR regulatory domain-containing protein [Thermodesulfobacteriota bacterium]
MIDKTKKKKLAILKALQDADRPLRSIEIFEELAGDGHEISERTIRFYMSHLIQEGLVEYVGKRCYRITERGSQEFESSAIYERVGFLSARIDQMTYRMNFDLSTRTGTVVFNVTVVEPKILLQCLNSITKVYANGYAMGVLATLLPPGERCGTVTIPEGMVGMGTVCSITLNGVLLHHGIPTVSRFGGLLELHERKPRRFVEIIMYDGTSIDPLEIFIRSGMTDYLGAITTGTGRIGASFREFPSESRQQVEDLAHRLQHIGLGGFLRIGRPGQPLLDIPVNEGRVGAVVIGGLNPVAILEECGVRVYSRALAGLIDFSRLFHYEELEDRIKEFL